MANEEFKSLAASGDDTEHKLVGVIWHWLRAYRVAEAARREALLDRASYDSFPASDPVAPAASADPETDDQSIECVIDNDQLTLRCLPRGSTPAPQANGGEPDLEFEGSRPDGGQLHVRIHLRSVPSAQGAVERSEATLPDDPVHAGPVGN